MQTVTINKLRNFARTNQHARERSKIDIWKDQKRGYKFNGHYRETSLRNVLAFHEYTDSTARGLDKEIKVYKHIDIEGQEIDRENHTGMYIYIHTPISHRSQVVEYTIRNMHGHHDQRQRFTYNSNAPLTEQQITQQVVKHFEKCFLYAPGLFRRIQLTFCISKERAKARYKAFMQKEKQAIKEPFDIEEYVLQKFNIEPTPGIIADHQKLYSFCKNYVERNGKPKETKAIARMNIWHLMENFDGDIDEAESLIYGHMQEERNVIFI